MQNNNRIGFGTTFVSFPTQELQKLTPNLRDRVNRLVRKGVELETRQNHILMGMSPEGEVFDKMVIINNEAGMTGVCYIHAKPKKDKAWYNFIIKHLGQISGAKVKHMKDKETPKSEEKFIELHRKWTERCLFPKKNKD